MKLWKFQRQPLGIVPCLLLLWLGFHLPLGQAAVMSLPVGPAGLKPGQLLLQAPDGSPPLRVPLGHSEQYLVSFPVSGLYQARWQWPGTQLREESLLVLLPQSPDDIFFLQFPTPSSSLLWSQPNGERFRSQTIDSVVYVRPRQALIIWLQGPTQKQVQWQKLSARLEKSQDLPVAPLIDPQAPDDDQLRFEPDDQELLSGPEISNLEQSLSSGTQTLGPPPQRPASWQVAARIFREQFRIDKKDRFESPAGLGLGNRLQGVWPVGSLSLLRVSLDTHATETEYEDWGENPPKAQQKRVLFRLGLGIDLWNVQQRSEAWSLYLGPELNALMLPIASDEEKKLDPGLSLRLVAWQRGLDLSVHAQISGSRELAAQYRSRALVWQCSLLTGLYLRRLRASSGEANALFEEIGLLFGIERRF